MAFDRIMAFRLTMRLQRKTNGGADTFCQRPFLRCDDWEEKMMTPLFSCERPVSSFSRAQSAESMGRVSFHRP